MKFAVWILVLAAALSLLALLAGEMLPPAAKESLFFRLLNISDPFRSWWFRLMLAVLSLSLIVCVIERAPILIKQAFKRTFRADPAQLASMPNYARITVANGEQVAEAFLRRLGTSVKREESGRTVALAGVAGGLSRLGPLFSHFGMLLLIIGGLVVSLTTYNTNVVGVPGSVVSLPEWGFQLRIDDFRILYYPVGFNQWVEAPGGRRGKVDQMKGDSARVTFGTPPGATSRWFKKDALRTDFLVGGDGGGSMPFQGNIKSYVSSVTVVEGERELYKREIEVNSPLRERGYRFYQTSFQSAPSKAVTDSVIISGSEGSNSVTIALKVGGEAVPLGWGDYSAAANEFFPDFKMDAQFKPFSASDQLRNPAARIELFRNGVSLGTTWAFGGATGHMGGDFPVAISLIDIAGMKHSEAGYATVLEVTKESGRPIVWAGFIIMTLGLIMAYMTSHRQVWALILKQESGRDEVHLAGASQRDAEHFRRIWDERLAPLRSQQVGEQSGG